MNGVLLPILCCTIWLGVNAQTKKPKYRELAFFQQEWENGDWNKGTQRKCSYNSSGKLQAHLHYRWGEEKWVPHSKMQVTYNKAGRRIEDITSQPKGKTWAPLHKISYRYDDRTRKVLNIRISNMVGDKWKEESLKAVVYQPDGKISQEFLDIWPDSGQTIKYKYSFGYDENGRKAAKLEQELQIGEWITLHKIIYNYNEAGKLSTEVWTKGLTENAVKRASHTYDKIGNLIEQSWQELEDEEWVNTSKLTWKWQYAKK